MRLAVSGAHATGKTTLIGELLHRLPNYIAVDEAYYTLLDEGHSFTDVPTVDDFELQFERSCSILSSERGADILFDRCPADYLAYLAVLERQESSNRPRLELAMEAIKRLDLVVFLPIEQPDRISIDGSEFPRLRKQVNATLRQMLVEDNWGIGATVITVRGGAEARVSQVLAQIQARQCHGD